ncbi:MAG: multiheme c-type cytochrome, partial [Deltaproteobacteria bacterium]|nr:multiheme c-type cytochrome [Deltaproteobacteria bacterium]
AVDKTLHMNGRIDGGGESAGGTNCGGCHTAYFNAMNGVTAGKISKHTLGSDVPQDSASSWTGTDLNSSVALANRTCVTMCHGDHSHDLTSPVTATHENNVYLDATTQATRASGSATRIGSGAGQNRAQTDFDSTLNTGLCASCHANPIVAGAITVGAANFGASAHDYATNTVGAGTYTWNYALHDASLFARNCTKCHASRVEGNTPTVASGTVLTAVHYSDTDPNLLAGTTNPAGNAANFICYNCHGSAAAPAVGAQGNRSGKDIQTQILHATTANQSGHPANSDTHHNSAAEFTSAAFGNALGVTAGAGQRHASCLDCHDPHEAKPTSGNARVTGSATNGNVSGPALQGAWGAQLSSSPAFWTAPTLANFTKKTLVAGTDLQATLCFKCHTGYYWGAGTPPLSPSGGFTETDQSKEFNPANVGNFAGTWASGETAGSFHPVLASAGSNLGATGNIKAPWTRTSLMVCSDCHESDTTTDPSGPHGSAFRFILKGPNTTWSSAVLNSSSGMPAGTFCINCHNANFSGGRFTQHTNGRHNIACANCHSIIPHGGPRPGLLNAGAGANANVGGTIAGWDGVAPYWQGTASNRLFLISYPANNTNSWSQGNCGCNGTGH